MNMQELVLNVAYQMVAYGVLNSILVASVLTTIQKWIDTDPDDGIAPVISTKKKILVALALGFCFFPLLQVRGLEGWTIWGAKIFLGFFIGAFSVLAYTTAIGEIMKLIPNIFAALNTFITNRITGGGK